MSDDNHLPRWRSLMDLQGTRRRQMRAVKAAERLVYDAYEAGDREECRKAVTALSNAVRAYVSVVELHELEKRVERLEGLHDRLNETNGAHAAP